MRVGLLPKQKKGGSAELPPEVSPLPDPLKVARIVCGEGPEAGVVVDTETPAA